jgi:methyltransferase (TIGR00027 family)
VRPIYKSRTIINLRDDLPSLTAGIVAFARGVGFDSDAPDPLAQSMLPAPFSLLLRLTQRRNPAHALFRLPARALSLGLVDHVSLRTLVIDRALLTSIADGVDQVVILGAGLDSRAYRLPLLASADVYEVDHPSTQAYKRNRVRDAKAWSRTLVHVPVDFESQRVGEELKRAGHDSARRTFWIWEGVTMYLSELTMVASLSEVNSRSIDGSRLAVTYALPKILSFGPTSRRIAEALFSGIGEPMIGTIESDEMANVLRGASFDVESDTNNNDWAREFGCSRSMARLLRAERLIVAEFGTRK